MSANKETVEMYMDSFESGDRVLSCLTDDIEWEIPGGFHIRGKAEFAKHIREDDFAGDPVITVTRLIEGDDIVVAEGTVRAQRNDGALLELAYCDVFEMNDGKIRRLISYLVPTD